MMVLVDTSIWSMALRRSRQHLAPDESRHVALLEELVREGRAQLLGVVRQELLSGIRYPEQFDRLREHLHAFPDVALDREDYERAAEMNNTCRRQGVSGSDIDFLICSVGVSRGWAIQTSDRDFERYGGHLALTLYP
jgi:predicted nucleic acid-binding protein